MKLFNGHAVTKFFQQCQIKLFDWHATNSFKWYRWLDTQWPWFNKHGQVKLLAWQPMSHFNQQCKIKLLSGHSMSRFYYKDSLIVLSILSFHHMIDSFSLSDFNAGLSLNIKQNNIIKFCLFFRLLAVL